MKAIVLKPFRDKNTREMQRPGKAIEVTGERFEEINSSAPGGFLAAVGDSIAAIGPAPSEMVKVTSPKKKAQGGKRNA